MRTIGFNVALLKPWREQQADAFTLGLGPQSITITNYRRVLKFRTTRTFEHYKFLPLIRLSYAEFGLSYATAEKTLRAIAQ
jgi:hypothetical protein